MDREYFETGCVCVLSGELDKAPVAMAENDAAEYYMTNCRCTRHPEAGVETRERLYSAGSLKTKEPGTGNVLRFGIKAGNSRCRDSIFTGLWRSAIDHYGSADKFTVVSFQTMR